MKEIYKTPVVVALLLFTFASCSVLHTGSMKDDGKIEIDFVQVNDVYEIAPVNNGKLGGMARVAGLKKEIEKNNPNTLLIMAGDFVSPSVYNGLQYQGKFIRGKQMIEAMNAAGFDIAGFGNHEFDIPEKDLQSRLDESNFEWVSSNSFHEVNNKMVPFEKNNEPLPSYIFKTFHDKDGTTAKLGFIGINIPFNKAGYVNYKDPFAAASVIYNQIKDSCDAVIAITHQLVADDIKLAQQLPGLAVILGGHEHDMRFEKTGNIYITKAHSNAKSAFVVKLGIDKKTKTLSVTPQLRNLNDSIKYDSATAQVVRHWTNIADSSFRTAGFDAKKVLLQSGEPLDARDEKVRQGSSNLTKLITAAMEKACPDAQIAIFNTGSLRADDILYPPVTEYDIIRALPFGGAIREADITGRLIIKVLDAGLLNKGSGGFLQYSSFVTYNQPDRKWLMNGKPIEPDKIYKVAVPGFLISGKEANLDFFSEKNYDVYRLYNAATSVENSKSDIRLALIKYLESINRQ